MRGLNFSFVPQQMSRHANFSSLPVLAERERERDALFPQIKVHCTREKPPFGCRRHRSTRARRNKNPPSWLPPTGCIFSNEEREEVKIRSVFASYVLMKKMGRQHCLNFHDDTTESSYVSIYLVYIKKTA